MDTMPTCPSCGKPLAPDAPKGLCQECLLKAGFPTGTQTETGEPKRTFIPPTIEELAAKFPQLEILELIGRGGMGAVYKIRQKQLGRIAALKILPPGVGDQSAFAERFTREARALAALNHPGIVTLYEFGQANGLFYFLMEFVDGVNLRQLLNAGRISSREALAIVPQICDALQYAHDQGIIHRDIKPENILLDRRGRVKVADFGVARLMEGETEAARAGEPVAAQAALTEAGKVLGTPQYMAPEQKEKPTEVDHRADIYSLGVVLYQMLTGELPAARIEPPSKKVRLDVRLDEIVLRALEKEPEHRYQAASALKTEVETIAMGAPPPMPPRAIAERQPAASETEKISNRNSQITPRIWPRRIFWLIATAVSFPFGLFLMSILGAQLARQGIIIGSVITTLAALSIIAVILLVIIRGCLKSFKKSPADETNPWPRRLVALVALAVTAPILLFAGSMLLYEFARASRAQSAEMEARKAAAVAASLSRGAHSAPEIESVVVDKDKAVVKARQFKGEGMIIMFGAMTNRWEPKHLDSLLAVTLEWPWLGHGANWVVRRAHGLIGYNLDTPTGAVTGEIEFHAGTPTPDADGSYVIGSFQPESPGAPGLPIAVKLVTNKPAP